MTHLTPARLREIIAEIDADCCTPWEAETVQDLARALLAKTETCDAAVALLRDTTLVLRSANSPFTDKENSKDWDEWRNDVIRKIVTHPSFLAQHSPTAPDATVSGAETEGGTDG